MSEHEDDEQTVAESKPPGIVIVPSTKDVPTGSRWIIAQSGQAQFIHQQYQYSIRKTDGSPLTRQDVQFDLLLEIFENPLKVFTDPKRVDQPQHTEKLTFGALYMREVLNSPRCAKSHREAMTKNVDYARDYAMMCLLVNVGRCNTTLAFYPEMRTSMRSYHPVPCLQRTGNNLQDAPRMKNMLKYCYESMDGQGSQPSTPHELKARVRNNTIPSTNVANLLFVLNTNATTVSRQHFQTTPPLGFHDLFVPINLDSKERARAFLWLMFNYLESGDNPFAPEGWTEKNPDIVPPMKVLSQKEMQAENVDPPDEVELARTLVESRKVFLREHAEEEAQKKALVDAKGNGNNGEIVDSDAGPDAPKKGRKRRAAVVAEDSNGNGKEKEKPAKRARKSKNNNTNSESKQGTPVPGPAPSSALSTPIPPRQKRAERERDYDLDMERDRDSSPPLDVQVRSSGLSKSRTREPIHKRTMLQQAFYIVSSHDALYDSNGEDADEYVQADVQQRLHILERLGITQPHGPIAYPSSHQQRTPPLPSLRPARFDRDDDYEYDSEHERRRERSRHREREREREREEDDGRFVHETVHA